MKKIFRKSLRWNSVTWLDWSVLLLSLYLLYYTNEMRVITGYFDDPWAITIHQIFSWVWLIIAGYIAVKVGLKT